MKNSPQTEKRDSIRLEANLSLNLDFKDPKKGIQQSRIARAINLNESGLLFVLDSSLPGKTNLINIELFLPSPFTNISTDAEIITRNDKKCIYSARFMKLDGKTNKELIKYINRDSHTRRIVIDQRFLDELGIKSKDEDSIIDSPNERRKYNERRAISEEDSELEDRSLKDRRSTKWRRVFPRVSYVYKAKIKIPGSGTIEGKTFNLANNGLSLTSDSFVEKSDSPVLLNLEIDGKLFESKAELIRIRKNDENGSYVYGIKFNPNDELSLLLNKKLKIANEYIAQYIKPKLNSLRINTDKKEAIINFFKTNVKSFLHSYFDYERYVSEGYLNEKKAIEKLRTILDNIIQEGEIFIQKTLNKKGQMKVKELFREMIGNWVYQSSIMKHALVKPRGYPGDYKIIEIVYNEKLLSDKIGGYFDQYFLDNPYATAVRNRKDLMKDILMSKALSLKDNQEFKILNVACGSAREIKDLFNSSIPCKGKMKFILIDHDEEALNFSKQTLTPIKPSWADVEFIKDNLFRFRKENKKYLTKYGNQNLIYSIGLADYLPDKILTKFFEFCDVALAPSGKFIIAHKDKDKYVPLPHNWFCDWNFIPRNEPEFIQLVRNSFGISYDMHEKWEKSGVIFYLILNKN